MYTGGALRPDEWMGRHELRSARMRRGLTQTDACKETGLSRSMWSQLESGVRTPSLTTAIKLHEFFGIPNEKIGVKKRYIQRGR